VTAPRLLVVSKTSSYQTYVEQQDDPLTRALLARNDPTVARVLRSHNDHDATVREVLQAIDELGATAHSVESSALAAPTGDAPDLVVTIGGDGTLLAASHEVSGTTPILGVNSAPEHSVGFFCGAQKGNVKAALASALAGTMPRTVVSRMQVDLNAVTISRRVLNDALLCHEIPAATSRYILEVYPGDGRRLEEEQKSSGLWIGPAAGSTAAQRSAGGHILPLTSHRVQYVVREPYTPRGVPLSLSRGTVDDGGSIVLRSKMRQAKLFLDGPHVVHAVGLGDVITLRRSEETLTVLGLSRTSDAPARASKPPSRRGGRTTPGSGKAS
jgi:NAD+ kinase